MTGPSSVPRGERSGQPGAHWETELQFGGEIVVPDDAEPARANRATRRAATRRAIHVQEIERLNERMNNQIRAAILDALKPPPSYSTGDLMDRYARAARIINLRKGQPLRRPDATAAALTAAITRVRAVAEAGPTSGTTTPGEWENGYEAACANILAALEETPATTPAAGTRHTADTITSDDLDQLYARISALEAVAASNRRHVQHLVPELEAADTARHALRTRAEQTEARLLRAATIAAEERDRSVAAEQRAEQAEAAIERVTTVCHDLPYEHVARILAALDQDQEPTP
ncbi:hypothetical protein [Streptomyces jumonjinensis]|uniref:Uncharacterized protein n=1 Tax=Streptomyces jumonjinensis TaxID=1945 RepID=A0A646KNI2_STRJU|nr:hypothetical protein [Streptomyces jumonjinensis]MQT03879.1 hypothetical protein [Streptomyces jumonjinensis]